MKNYEIIIYIHRKIQMTKDVRKSRGTSKFLNINDVSFKIFNPDSLMVKTVKNNLNG